MPYLEVHRIKRMKVMHYTIEAVMEPLVDIAQNRLSFRTRDDEFIRLYFAIGAYCADTVEMKDLL